ncbi:hypothetical protein [Corallococcus carmarthensis]|uniref:hypothetical protein n=1 Tax=Corallococcus carmarthensis TaxID=2316728 RepID=UPI001FC94FBD|nr:hypothetical protein [Corallococcus carmarthensis]
MNFWSKPDDLQVTASSVGLAQSRSSDVDATSYLSSRPEYPAWLELRSNLKENFDDIRGDTFCEGEYSNRTKGAPSRSGNARSHSVRRARG